jgi:hypothetical protein
VAISYSTLFQRLGKLVKYTNAYLALQGTTLLGSGSGADDILDQYNNNRELVPSVQRDYAGFATAVAGWIGRLKSYADATLADLQDDLNAPSSSPSTILPLLALDMAANAQTIKACTIASPAVAAGGSNVGNGQLVVSKKNVNGADDERIVSETVAVTCTSSKYDGGASSGAEGFSIVGFPRYEASSYLPRGNGSGSLSVGDASNLLSNGGFETFSTTDVPDSWTKDAGATTTNVAQETVNVHRGASALKLKGDGATTTVTLHQAISSLVGASTIYAVGCWVRKGGTVNAGSNLQVSVKGTGFTTVSLFNADPSTLTTAYAFVSAFIQVPAAVPADLKVEVTWTAANAAGATAVVLVDDVVLQAPTDFGHAQYALFAGASDFAAGDRFTVTTTRSASGVFQDWFGRFYNVALPSNAGGAETQGDALAT